MRFAKKHWRALRRYLLIFTAITLLPLALIYLVGNEQFYKIRNYEATKYDTAHFSEQSFRYPIMLLGKNKDRRTKSTGSARKKISIYDKYINETHVALLPQEAVQSLRANEIMQVEQRIQDRRKVLKEKCHEHGLDVLGNDSWHKPNAWEFLVNRKYHVIWCNVFKAASSSWMFNFNLLAGYSPEFLQKSQQVPLMLARQRYPRVTINELLEAQNDSITFIIARHPFERLLSAYRDKFVHAVPHSFHDKLGRKIVRQYRKKNEAGANTAYPTFAEFVQYLLDQIKYNNFIDMHFISTTQFCTPCVVNFDVILKFETLEQDQLYLIEKTGLKRLIAPEWRNAGKGKNTLELLNTFYSQLTLQELQSLYDYYKYDFEIFDYSADAYFKMAHAKSNDAITPEQQQQHKPPLVSTTRPVAGIIEEDKNTV